MEKDYPSIEVSYELVDAVAMRLIQSPKNYDVLITENLFGDILTDEASVISGSMFDAVRISWRAKFIV